jgi:2-keto-3-deoxy-L-rhamnonate aldolase RhmA
MAMRAALRIGLRTGVVVAVVSIASIGRATDPFAQVSPAGGGRFNTIAERFEKGEPAFNGEAWQLLPDMEHNAFRLDEVEAALTALKPAGAARPVRTPIVRIPYEASQDSRHLVKQLLDSGLMGIILPGVETAEQATTFVRSMRYPPQRITKPELREPVGSRGWSPTAALALWGWTPDEYAVRADTWPLNAQGELMAIAMIESPEAVKNIRSILSVRGLSAILIG